MPQKFTNVAPISGVQKFTNITPIGGGPDFAANPPPAAGPHVDMHESYLLGPESDRAGTPIKPGDVAAGMLQNAYDLSVPNIANQLVKKHTGIDIAAKAGLHGTELKDMPQEAATTMLPILAGGIDLPEPVPVARGSVARAMPAAEAPPVENNAGGIGSRAAEVVKRRVSHLPGVQAAKDVDYVVRGPKAKPEAAAPGLSSNADGIASGWPSPSPELVQARGLMEGGKAGVDPAAGLGRIPVRGSIAEKMAGPSPIAATPAAQQSATPPPAPKPAARPVARGTLNKMMDQELGKALGAKQLDPKVPLRGQIAGRMPADSDSALPEGHKAVDSSALRSYNYDAPAREFHARATSGSTIYIYGDVTPETAADFESAPSKGKAWQMIRQNHPLVAKIVDGKRIAVKPAAQ